jgi:hypothetical protein
LGIYKKPEFRNQILSSLEGKNMEKEESFQEFRDFYIRKLIDILPSNPYLVKKFKIN